MLFTCWCNGSAGRETAFSAVDTGDVGLIPGLGRSLGGGNGNPLQYSCLEIPWTEEPGRLQSMGLQRVRHNSTTKHSHSIYSSRKGKQNWIHFCEMSISICIYLFDKWDVVSFKMYYLSVLVSGDKDEL